MKGADEVTGGVRGRGGDFRFWEEVRVGVEHHLVTLFVVLFDYVLKLWKGGFEGGHAAPGELGKEGSVDIENERMYDGVTGVGSINNDFELSMENENYLRESKSTPTVPCFLGNEI